MDEGTVDCLLDAAGRLRLRSLVRLVDRDVQYAYAIVPAWSPREQVAISLVDLPEAIQRHLGDVPYRCHARVNSGAKDARELRFSDWEEG